MVTQDDAHIFCTEEQIGAEAAAFIALTLQVYKDFGFDEVALKLSTRPVKRVGSEELWDRAEASMAKALNDAGLAWELQAGEGAFSGPQIVLAACGNVVHYSSILTCRPA